MDIPGLVRDCRRPTVGERATTLGKIGGEGGKRPRVLFDCEKAAPTGAHESETQAATARKNIDEGGRGVADPLSGSWSEPAASDLCAVIFEQALCSGRGVL